MLPFRVRRFRDRRGEDVVLLIPRGSEPYFYPNAFITADYRNTRKSPNTCEKVLRSIGMAIMWAGSVGRDLDRDLAEGKFLTYSEADDLARFLGLSAQEQERECEPLSSVARRKPHKVLNLESFRPRATEETTADEKAVPDQEVGNRLRWVAKYAEWHLNRRVQSNEKRGQTLDQMRLQAESAISRLRELAPSVDGFIDDDETLEAPDVEIIQRIDALLHPDTADNPFRSDFVKQRNYVIWRLLLDTGARRFEIRAAKSADVTINPPRLKIPRGKGGSKRTVAFRKETALLLDTYIMEYWTNLPLASPARKLGYLFCDQMGRHLSLRAFNRIFEALGARLDAQHEQLTPHAMRRFWNHSFSLKIDSTPLERRPSPQEELKMRTRLMGWATDGQAKRYNRRHIREAGDRIAQDMMDRLNPGLSNKE